MGDRPCICECHQEDIIDSEQTPSDQVEKDATPQVSPVEQDSGLRNVTATEEPPWRRGTGLPPLTLADTVHVFAQAAGDLHRISDRSEDYDHEEALLILRTLRAAIRRAQTLDALLVKHLWDHGQRGTQLLDGIGEVRVHRRDARVKWDERGTAEAIVSRKMEERGGETPDDPMEVVTWLLEAASIGYYRLGSLRAMHIDPDDYRHREKGTIAVDLPIPD